ncbi:MAG: hypothetical protein KJO07_24480, partial [Deltaproteobacteria bacterium]|nr:hypothetical protein [Deltaproteobacteria bacterium]
PDKVQVVIDAGVPRRTRPDAALARPDAGPPVDAGLPADATPMATTLPSQRLDAAAEPARDAGADGGALAMADAGVDGGSLASAEADAGTEDSSDAIPAGAQADFKGNVPKGHTLSVLLRFDRLRKTPWAAEAEQIIAPMPDYRMIVGGRSLVAVDLFESLFIATSDPSDVTATTLIANYSHSQNKIRGLLSHARSKVKWTSAAGGPLGTRVAGWRAPGDDRVYHIPHKGWVVLTKPRYLGAFAKPTPGQPLTPRADKTRGPKWVRNIPTVNDQSGSKKGPFAIVSAHGLKGKLSLPSLGGADKLPVPSEITTSLELDPRGFLVRGVLGFEDLGKAKGFIKQARKVQQNLLGGFLGRRLLKRFNVVNAVQGLQLKRNGKSIAFTTSMTVSESRTMLRAVAGWTRSYFLGR